MSEVAEVTEVAEEVVTMGLEEEGVGDSAAAAAVAEQAESLQTPSNGRSHTSSSRTPGAVPRYTTPINV